MGIFKRISYGLLLLAIGLNISAFQNSAAAYNRTKDLFWQTAFSSSYKTAATTRQTNLTSTQVKAITDKVSTGVVSIYAYESEETPSSQPALPWPFSRTGQTTTQTIKTTTGSGFFIDSDGDILTNKHVVSSLDAVYMVGLSDGTKVHAQVVYRDSDMDLAVVKISGNNYRVLPTGDSSKLKVGQPVLSIGNAYGKQPNYTTNGTITALHQNILATEDDNNAKIMHDLIEMSSQLYPGNSGGPTFDANGNVIGINVAMSSEKQNDSFAIPISYAKDIITYAKGM